MSSTTTIRRPLQAPSTPRRPDEDFINSSLLANIDAQADAEPMSSDSEAPLDSTSPGSSSVTSPTMPFHLSGLHSALPRGDSPPPGLGPKSPQYSIDSFMHQHARGYGPPMFNSGVSHGMELGGPMGDGGTPKQFDKMGAYANAGTTPRGYSAFANANVRARHSVSTGSGTTYRDAYASYPPMDFNALASAPSLNRQSFDAIGNRVNAFELSQQQQQPAMGLNSKVSFSNLDPFSAAAAGLPLHAGSLKNSGPRQQLHTQGTYNATAAAAMHSQTPFGPHLAAVNPTSTVTPGQGMTTVTGNVQNTSQEEISTIFVVGFPDDMQEREFQNMFTFSPGFEAATLKIPNRDSTAYGAAAAGGNIGNGSVRTGFAYSATNDPYNLVTMNQGGVIVDNGRDGTTSSWPPAALNGHPEDSSSFSVPGTAGGQNLPQRKQIIGFAKFRTRQEALDAREVLQGRRIDAEKGAVLKAEMAKKNLHTKRGVGQPGAPGALPGAGAEGSGPLGGMSSISGLGSLMSPTSSNGAELPPPRERELVSIGAMGFGALGQRPRERLASHPETDDELEPRSLPPGVLSTGVLGPRGARERAEDEERVRRRVEKDMRLRSASSAAFDAFHSVPSGMSRNAPPASSLLTEDTPPPTVNGYGLPAGLTSQDNFATGLTAGSAPWSGAPGAIRKIPSALSSSASMSHGSELAHDSPTHADGHPSAPNSTSSQDGFESDTAEAGGDRFPAHSAGPISPPGSLHHSLSGGVGRIGPGLFRRAFSPGSEASHGHGQPYYIAHGHGHGATSSASSTSGSSQIGQVDPSTVEQHSLLVDTEGQVSPQMPSPTSNSSSGHSGGATSGGGSGHGHASTAGHGHGAMGKVNAADQNPPINTLYVGNLPNSPVQYDLGQLETKLREVFSREHGYRKLSFKPKQNGPMCFVEFEDVQYATVAMNALYGHDLDGMVKGGIRLSYSKNPLGVRTATQTATQVNASNASSPHVDTAPYLAGAYHRQLPRNMVDSNEGGVAAALRRQQQQQQQQQMVQEQAFMASPPPAYALSPPPPRFYNTSPSGFNAGPVGNPAAALSSTAFPRAPQGSYALPPHGGPNLSNFSSFGFTSRSPSSTAIAHGGESSTDAGAGAPASGSNASNDAFIRAVAPLSS